MKSRHRKNPWVKFSVFAVLALLLLPLFLTGLVSAPAIATPEGMGICALGITGTLNLLDLSKANSSDVVHPLIEESVGDFPEMTSLAAAQLGAGETSYQTLVRTGYPSAGFHNVGEGFSPSKSTTRMERFETFPFGGRVQAAKHIADIYKKGGAAGYFAFEALGIMKSALFTMCKQIWYGRAADGKGFPGLKNFTAYGSTVTDPLTGKVYPMAINATGTTANSASSCYIVVSNENNVELEFGTGSPFDLPEPRIGDFADPNDANKTIEGYISVLQGWAGLQTPNVHCVRRIFNLTDETGKGMTDALLAQVFKTFPAGVKPTGIYMSANQQYRLQVSRTAILQAGGSNAVATADSYKNVPIYATDAIGDTDAIESAALSEE